MRGGGLQECVCRRRGGDGDEVFPFLSLEARLRAINAGLWKIIAYKSKEEHQVEPTKVTDQ